MIKQILIKLLKGYKKNVSPYLVRSCRFQPSCSEYSAEAIKEYGVVKGALFSCWRIARCNPLSQGGYDPIGKNKKEK